MKKIFLFLIGFLQLNILLAQVDQWTQLGMVKFPENPSVQTTGMGRVSHLVFHPTDTNILFAVSASGGVWRSVNDGQTWGQITDGLPNTACASLCLNTKNPKTMYLGTGDANYYGGGMGVWKSMNNGGTWYQSNSGMGNALVVQIAMHPTDTNTLVATTNAGIFKTKDGGATWTKKSTITDSYNDLVVKPGSKLGLYATSFQFFYYSRNFGETWTQTKISNSDSFSGIFIGVTPADTNLIYCAAWRNKSWGTKTYFGGVYKSKDAGINWKQQSTQPQILGYSSDGSSNDGQGAYNLTITVDPKDPASVYVGAINIWKSRDSAVTWKLKSHWVVGVHADKHHFIFSPLKPNKLYITHDGGLDRSLDTGNTWKTITDGLSASEFYKMGQSSLNREKALGGLQDNGLNYYKNGTFYTIRGGDYGGDFLFDYLDSNYQYYQGGGNQYNLDNFSSRGINGQDKSVYELHRKDTNIMYMGYHNLYKTNNLRNATVNWTKLSDSILHYGKASTTAIAHCKANNNFLYWAKNNGVLYRVDNVNSGNPKFVLLSKPSGAIQQMTTHARDSNVVYITIGSKIYKSSDKGKTWWDFSKNLPSNYIVSFQVDDRIGDSSIYVATNFGVFYKNRTLTQWRTISKNLPAIAGITDMEIFNDGTPKSCLRISTYGRGLWQTSLYQYQTKTPVAAFDAFPTTTACPKNYIFNDVSGGGKYTRVWNIVPYNGYKYLNGTDSTFRQPEIQFTKTGFYIVTLTINNSFGTSTISKTIQYSELMKAASCSVNTTNQGYYSIGIYRFEMAGIDKSSNYSLFKDPNLEDFTCSQVAVVKPGTTYNAWLTNGNSYNEYAAIYIDYNNDGDFLDANELAASYPSGKGRRNAAVKILGAPPVTNTYLRMRVVSDWTAIGTACGTLSYGQAEDYALFIDGQKPIVYWSMPKPKIYKQFTATIKFSEYCPTFDTSKLKLTNAKFIGLTKRNPFTYDIDITPLKPGKIYVNLLSGIIADQAGNVNFGLTDSTLFEMALTSFTFPGVSKRDSLIQNDTGGWVRSYVYYGTIKDSLRATFTVTDSAKVFVGNTPQISGITKNNFNSPVLYTVKNIDGAFIKKYLVTVITLPDTTCELFDFSFKLPNVIGIISPNQSGGNVDLTVPYGTDISSRVAYANITKTASLKAENKPETNGITTHDFRKAILYRVIAQDTNYFKDYWVNVKVAKNTACDLLTWNITTPNTIGSITNKDTNGGYVKATLPFGLPRASQIASFTISDSAILKISGLKQTSGISNQNYTDTVIAIITSQDGKHQKQYKIIITNEKNDACEMFTFSLTSPAVNGVFTRDTTGGTIAISVPENTILNSLIGEFTVSDSAIVTVAGNKQKSGISVHDFTSPISYKVISHNGIKSKIYIVTTTKILGLHDPKLDIFEIYPNPANNFVHLELSSNIVDFKYSIWDAVGRNIKNGNTKDIDLENIPPGAYEIRVQTAYNVQVRKLVIE